MKATWLPALALGFLLALTTPASYAQPSGQPGPDQPARREIRAYVQQNVLPTVRQQRQKLEPRLSTSDKAQLAVYRAQLHDLRQRGKDLRQAARSTTTATARPAFTEAQQQQLRELHTETRSLLLSVSQLAQKYDTEIARLAQELKPQKEQWAADLQAITTRHASPEQAAHRSKHHRRDALSRFFQPAAFLLLDPAAQTPTLPAPTGTRVYPNPTATATQLDYEVQKAGAVTVELLDGRGNTLRTVHSESKQEKGPHSLPVDVADLPVGTYFFKITTRTGAETKRFVKE
ncbi:T9SS type A sorting domain-containing protein [Hymenobacter swuensis]|uniref:Secretion system C-terminal sorting domain-containing protein n=1 Tax=Hymenobacter swuensis DY53 TaxID=1227739 RepID=W8ETT9_9BACT|nr:T9SS type A sorting domain-containing protein [Hymenobacter swuensis]AHJ96579.1 hypothetical protein Hsw_0984 [Hymenobacter swuensis DY53]